MTQTNNHPTVYVAGIPIKEEDNMKRTIAIYSIIVILGDWNLAGLTPAHGFSNSIEPGDLE